MAKKEKEKKYPPDDLKSLVSSAWKVAQAALDRMRASWGKYDKIPPQAVERQDALEKRMKRMYACFKNGVEDEAYELAYKILKDYGGK